jgi:signal peptidase I
MAVLCVCATAYLAATSFEVALVPTASMENTVLVGDHVLVMKLPYAPKLPLLDVRLPRWGRARRGDLVSFTHKRSGLTYLKRVVAIGGDTVEIREGKLIVNGAPVAEQYVSSSRLWRTMPEQHIRPGELFVLGDNRDNSEDSRYWGTVPESAVVGEPAMVLWSFRAPTSEWLDNAGHVRPAAYFDVATHLFTRTRWSRVATKL